MTTETDEPRATTEAVVDESTGELVPVDVISRPIPLDVISPAPPARDTFAILADAIRLAEVVADTELVPSALRRRPDAVVAVVLKGHELGLSPMHALSAVHLISGRPALSAEAMRALVLARGHTLLVEASDTEATVRCRRREWQAEQWSSHTFTLEDAQRAGLAGKGTWASYPRALLTARATSEACRAIFPDVIAGLSYTPEEIGSIEVAPTYTPTGQSETPARSRAPGSTRRAASAPGPSEGERSKEAPSRAPEELAGAALDDRLVGLSSEERAAFDEEIARRNLPFPPTSAATMRAVVGLLDAIEAKRS
jgi:hypothetical protein